MVRPPRARPPRGTRAARFALALLALAGHATASPSPAIFEVDRSDEARDCPDRSALQAAVERILRQPIPAALANPQAALRIDLRFARRHGTYEASLRLRGPKEGERSLSDPGSTCAALAEAAEVTIALLLDRDLTPDPVPAPGSRTETDREPEPPPRQPSSVVGVRAGTGPAFGFVGSPSLATSAALGLELYRHWLFEAGGLYVFPRSSELGHGTVRVSLTAGFARACGMLFDAGTARAGLCLQPSAGQLRGEGAGYAVSESARLFWMAIGAGAGVWADLGGSLSGSLSALAAFPLRRQTFSVQNVGTLADSEAVGVLVELSLGLRLF
jgi:hypothetical protein